jgi:hypothetical protein
MEIFGEDVHPIKASAAETAKDFQIAESLLADDLTSLLNKFYTDPHFETDRNIPVKEAWFDDFSVKETLKPIWKDCLKRISYDKEKRVLRLRGMGSSHLHDSIHP